MQERPATEHLPGAEIVRSLLEVAHPVRMRKCSALALAVSPSSAAVASATVRAGRYTVTGIGPTITAAPRHRLARKKTLFSRGRCNIEQTSRARPVSLSPYFIKLKPRLHHRETLKFELKLTFFIAVHGRDEG
jgi:hypothetical protein